MKKINYIYVLFMIILLCTESFASITGRIINNVGDPVFEAIVTFTDESNTNDTYYSTTDSNGNYEINLGVYFPPTDVVLIDIPNDQGHKVQLSWTLSIDDNIITHYNIYRSRNPELTEPVDIESFSSIESLIEAEENLTIHISQVLRGQNTFTDNGVPLNNVSYYYWIEASSDSGNSDKVAIGRIVTGVNSTNPEIFNLGENYPNPFNPTTTIPYTINSLGHVNLSIYNIMGQKVRTLVDDYSSIGSHITIWNGLDNRGNNIATGIYFYQLIINGQSESKKMLLLDGGNFKGTSTSTSTTKMTFDRSFSKNTKNNYLSKSTVSSESKTYQVLITGDDIETYSESGLTIVNGEIYNFVVARKISVIVIHGINFVSIPAGTFEMGQNGYIPGEKPVHTVNLNGFEMSTFEITNTQYVEYLYKALETGDITVDTSGVEGPGDTYLERQYIQYHPDVFEKCQIRYNETEGIFEIEEGMENNPITNISWYGAKAFALYYGFDLPTEAEWEYACRAETNTKYYTGDNLSGDGKTSTDLNYAGWYLENSEGISHPVGQKEPNSWGLYDMHGNITEICYDWYDWTYYTYTPINNPTGPPEKIISAHSVRGGNYENFAARCRSASRGAGGSGSQYEGFRVVQRIDSAHY